MNLVRFCRQNRYAVYLVTLFLVAAGLVAAFRLPSNIYPELNFPRIVVLAHSGDLAPDAMLLSSPAARNVAISQSRSMYSPTYMPL